MEINDMFINREWRGISRHRIVTERWGKLRLKTKFLNELESQVGL